MKRPNRHLIRLIVLEYLLVIARINHLDEREQCSPKRAQKPGDIRETLARRGLIGEVL